MYTVERQDNDVILDLCQNHFCQVVIVPHNLMNRFQLLDITVNKPVKSFKSFYIQVSQQLEKGIEAATQRCS